MKELPNEIADVCFILQKHQFRIDSNSEVCFSLLTDKIQGIKFKKNGDAEFTTPGTSKEVVGCVGGYADNVPSKIIRAENGDIVLDAINGNIVLKGKNIKIDAKDALGGQITLDSSRAVSVSASLINAQGDKITIAGANSASVVGGSTEVHAQISNESTTATDVLKSGFLGQILTAIEKFSEFFSSICK